MYILLLAIYFVSSTMILGTLCMNIVKAEGEDDNVVHFPPGIRFPLVERMSRDSSFGSMPVLRK
jgi:hypothetical protein